MGDPDAAGVPARGRCARALDAGEDVLAQATDDAWLVERAGGRVVVVEAPPANFKVTTPHDLRIAELLLAERAPGILRPC